MSSREVQFAYLKRGQVSVPEKICVNTRNEQPNRWGKSTQVEIDKT